jgi:hypothetical protein
VISTAWLTTLSCLATLAMALPAAASQVPAQRPRVDAVFVLDTTGSMGGLLEGAKQKVWSIANQIASAEDEPMVRLGLIAYRDRGDAYITQRHDLSGDIDEVYARLRTFQAGGGGDGPESVNQALNEAITKMSWSKDPGVYRVVFLVGDAPPHMDYQDDVKYAESVRLANSNDITINTVQCGGNADAARIWQEIASLSEGAYVAIASDGGMVAMTTPMDDKLAALQRDLASTVVPYGSRVEQEVLRAKVARSASAPSPEAASRLSYMAKSGGAVVSGRSDLLDAIKDGEVGLSSVPAGELPAELAKLDEAEREVYVKEKLDERKRINGEIAAVVADRDEWVQAETKRKKEAGKADGFDDKVMETIRSQAAEKGIRY